MERVEIERTIKKVFQNLFDVDPASITADASPYNVEGWNSMQHLGLVTSLEAEFDVSFGDGQVVEMRTFGLIVKIVDDALRKR